MEDLDTRVKQNLLEYASQNMSYKEISYLLLKQHGVHLSTNAIGKRLKLLGYPSRRGLLIHGLPELKTAIQTELQRNPATVGYRYMTEILRRKGWHVRRDVVMNLLKEVDPEGVELRRKRRILRKVYLSVGPNHVWHVDGYDKLKPYGFAIHGCIDGYSRKIMWLRVGSSNNDPEVVASYFVECMDKTKGCPSILQADPGTENYVMGAIQCTLRDGKDPFAGERSFRIVKSIFNQRIEAWWSLFRRHKTQWYMDLFRELELFGGFQKENVIDKYCLRYCFASQLQKELNETMCQWNCHFITRSRQAFCPGGRPDFLYSCPEMTDGWKRIICQTIDHVQRYGRKEVHVYQQRAVDCLSILEQQDILWAYSKCQINSTKSGNSDFDAFADRVFSDMDWLVAETAEEAIAQYFFLRDLAHE